MHMGTLGILRLCNENSYSGDKSLMQLGLAEQGRYRFPLISRRVPGAWTDNVLAGDPECETSFVSCAQELVAEGATAITADCGFALHYQQALARTLTVPVATSSLLLLPMVLATIPPEKKIGLVVADARRVTQKLLSLAGVHDVRRLVIDGLQGTASLAVFSSTRDELPVPQLIDDVDAMVDRVLAREPVAALVMECTGFVRLADRVRRRARIPVYDAALNVQLLMAAAHPESAS